MLGSTPRNPAKGTWLIPGKRAAPHRRRPAQRRGNCFWHWRWLLPSYARDRWMRPVRQGLRRAAIAHTPG